MFLLGTIIVGLYCLHIFLLDFLIVWLLCMNKTLMCSRPTPSLAPHAGFVSGHSGPLACQQYVLLNESFDCDGAPLSNFVFAVVLLGSKGPFVTPGHKVCFIQG